MSVPVIAIDGPAGAGKSTVSRTVAERSGLPFLDTGAMYRGVAFSALSSGTALTDEARLGEIAESVRLELDADGLRVDGVDATSAIRGPEVTAAVSVIATHSRVRTAMRDQQRLFRAVALNLHPGQQVRRLPTDDVAQLAP